ncbi:hypothetical protein EOD39_7147 [Acipenser ruthenus]|uniref:Uncharacterized protein n=1 Tax=Acipenser ruthenus TaxID=7906 RepID=A0A662YXJ4_ACIRT|nr:hypothetical protein EOD39_7147 [Acipenser ruthenus]
MITPKSSVFYKDPNWCRAPPTIHLNLLVWNGKVSNDDQQRALLSRHSQNERKKERQKNLFKSKLLGSIDIRCLISVYQGVPPSGRFVCSS